MTKKILTLQDIDAKQIPKYLENRALLQFETPIGQGQKTAWDELTRGLLNKRFDLIVLTIDKNGKRYERVRGTSTHAKITRQLKVAVVEYVLRPDAETPNWTND